MFAFGAVFASFHPQDRADREDSTSFSVKRPSSSGGGAAARGRVPHDLRAETTTPGSVGPPPNLRLKPTRPRSLAGSGANLTSVRPARGGPRRLSRSVRRTPEYDPKHARLAFLS